MAVTDLFRIKSLWVNFNFDYDESLANGRSGGVVSIWDSSLFVKEWSFVQENFVITKGTWTGPKIECFMINVYAPQLETDKVKLWNKLVDFIQVNNGNYIVCGDFNSIRCEDERMGSVFSRVNALNFNDFLARSQLIELNVGRHKFTRISSNGLKASLLDRFLINNDTIGAIPDIVVEALDDLISDHRPLIFKQKSIDFGPCPFKFYNSWLITEGFNNLVKDQWDSVEIPTHSNASNILKIKLKNIKSVLGIKKV